MREGQGGNEEGLGRGNVRNCTNSHASLSEQSRKCLLAFSRKLASDRKKKLRCLLARAHARIRAVFMVFFERLLSPFVLRALCCALDVYIHAHTYGQTDRLTDTHKLSLLGHDSFICDSRYQHTRTHIHTHTHTPTHTHTINLELRTEANRRVFYDIGVPYWIFQKVSSLLKQSDFKADFEKFY